MISLVICPVYSGPQRTPQKKYHAVQRNSDRPLRRATHTPRQHTALQNEIIWFHSAAAGATHDQRRSLLVLRDTGGILFFKSCTFHASNELQMEKLKTLRYPGELF